MADDNTDPNSGRPDDLSEIWLHDDGTSRRVDPDDLPGAFDASATRKIPIDDLAAPDLADVHLDPRPAHRSVTVSHTETPGHPPATAAAVEPGRTPPPASEGQVPLTRGFGIPHREDSNPNHLGAVPIVNPAQPPPGDSFRSRPASRTAPEGSSPTAPSPTGPTSPPTGNANWPDQNAGQQFGASADSGRTRPADGVQSGVASGHPTDGTMALQEPRLDDERQVKLGTTGVGPDPIKPPSKLAPVVGALAGILVVGALLWFFVIRETSDDPSPDETATQADTSPEVVPEADSTSPAAATPDPTEAPVTTALDPTTEVCPDPGSAEFEPGTLGPIVTCPEYPNGQPSQGLSDPGTGWIAVLDNIAIGDPAAVDASGAGIVEAIREAEERTARVGIYDSRSYASLPDPFWVVFAGPFSSEAAAQSYCAERPHLDPCTAQSLDN